MGFYLESLRVFGCFGKHLEMAENNLNFEVISFILLSFSRTKRRYILKDKKIEITKDIKILQA